MIFTSISFLSIETLVIKFGEY